MEAGVNLGPYEVVSRIGAGGMGEVWRACDSRLGRTVAIKVLRDAGSSDPGLKTRLEREAKILSRLNHPHICDVYDVGSVDGIDYVVMELVEGHTLADRLTRGALPPGEAISIGIAIAEALHCAHAAGIVHRDVKPGNIMLTKSGPKLLDFGIAKDVAPHAHDGATARKSLTTEGSLIGSVPYMSPEQAEGRPADTRTDIFALGAVLYEMLTGRPPFTGETRAALIAAIIGSEPPPLLDAQPLASRALEHVVAKCLEKNPDRRWQSAWDVAEELRFLATPQLDQQRNATHATRWRIVAAAAALAALVTGAFLVTEIRSRPRPEPMRLYFRPPAEAPIAHSSRRPVAVSPDGRQIAFLGGLPGAIWVQSLTSGEARQIEGTNLADAPFWSADGRFIAYYQRRELKKIAATGGTPEVIASSVPSDGGSAWSPEGTIITAAYNSFIATGLFSTSSSGGIPHPVLRGTEVRYFAPDFLADGRHYLVSREDQHGKQTIVLRRLGDDTERVILRDAGNGTWTETGHLLFVRGGRLMAVRFDLRQFEAKGEPAVLTESIGGYHNARYAEYSVSRDGRMLVFLPASTRDLVHVNLQNGLVTKLAGPGSMRISAAAHDGQRLAYSQTDADGNEDLWTFDLVRHIATRLTSARSGDLSPVWSPDDRQIAYFADGELMIIPLPEGTPRAVGKGMPSAWSPDGQLLLFWDGGGISSLRLSDGHVEPVVRNQFTNRWARFSPDGRWIAYESDESGTVEIYVQHFPDGALKTRVSDLGGTFPTWSRDGSRIYYYWPRGLRVVRIKVDGSGVHPGLPSSILEQSGLRSDFAESADGSAIIGFRYASAPVCCGLEVLVNWTSLVR